MAPVVYATRPKRSVRGSLVAVLALVIVMTGCSRPNGNVQTITPATSASTTLAGHLEPVAASFVVGPNEVVLGVRFVLAGDVLFAFDSATLSTAATQSLSVALAAARRYPSASLNIDGHTDASGSESYNQDLSVRRAEAVQAWFEDHGVPGSLINVTGLGESRPVVPNNTPENKAKNRRVEITLKVSR
jgi:outer membrane protein OmpA-like peptidoglycan-associated protein